MEGQTVGITVYGRASDFNGAPDRNLGKAQNGRTDTLTVSRFNGAPDRNLGKAACVGEGKLCYALRVSMEPQIGI